MKLLFADDEESLQKVMSEELPRMGHNVTVCPDGLTAVAALERHSFDCILVDLDMPGLSGVEVIAKAKLLDPDTEAVILTGKSSLESAISALRNGAFDYLTKPCKLAELQALLERVAEKRELTNKCRALQQRLNSIEGTPQLIGDSPEMLNVRQLIDKVAPTDATVLVRGETGTGKELVARAVHDHSPRAEMPFVAINCGALPENLIESELFGHRRGSFTGAEEQRIGLLEVAASGTVFLDEIGELPKGMQAKLLRFLEDGEIRRVGDNESFTVDTRVVCATHRNLEEMVADGDFREDLMYRINTFEIAVPPLRTHASDIGILAKHLLGRFRRGPGTRELEISDEVIEHLQRHCWPGNVRELANCIEHAAILCEDGTIEMEHLPGKLTSRRLAGPHFKLIGSLALREIEVQVIRQVLERNGGNKPRTAEELGISLKTLYNKLNQADNPQRQSA